MKTHENGLLDEPLTEYVVTPAGERFSDILREEDVEKRWVDHVVILKDDLICNKAMIAYDDMSIEIHMPSKFRDMPIGVARAYLRDHLDSIHGNGFRLSSEVQDYLVRKKSVNSTRAALHDIGMIDRFDQSKDAFLELCRKQALKMVPDRSKVEGLSVRWMSKTYDSQYIAYVSCPGRMIAVDRSLGYKSMSNGVFAILHEMLVYLSYSFETDEVDEDTLDAYMHTNPRWRIDERMFLDRGWRFRHCTTTMESQERW